MIIFMRHLAAFIRMNGATSDTVSSVGTVYGYMREREASLNVIQLYGSNIYQTHTVLQQPV